MDKIILLFDGMNRKNWIAFKKYLCLFKKKTK